MHRRRSGPCGDLRAHSCVRLSPSNACRVHRTSAPARCDRHRVRLVRGSAIGRSRAVASRRGCHPGGPTWRCQRHQPVAAGANEGRACSGPDSTSPSGPSSSTCVSRRVASSSWNGRPCPGPGGGVLVDNLVGSRRPTYQELSARRSDAIHVRVEGRADGSPAVDYTINAQVGVPLMTGPQESAAPVNHVVPLGTWSRGR